MRRKLLSNGFAVPALVAVLALAATAPAQAGQIFAFSYSLPAGTGPTPTAVSASGLFATTDLSGGSYTVTGAWGTWNGVAITGVTAPGGFGGNDNLLFPSAPLLDGNGLAFTVNGSGDDGLGNVNVFYDGTGYAENTFNVGVGQNFSTAAPSPVFFNFSYSIPSTDLRPVAVSASGILTAFQFAANSYLATNISGTRNGVNILSLLSPGAFGGNDNILFGTAPHLTANGLSYVVNGAGNDGSDVNVFYVGSYTENSLDVGFTPDFNLSQVQAQTPEPASMTLLCTGIPVVLFLVRRRSRALRRAA